MLAIKGIGPKKISTIWKELEIETLGELLYACNENRLTLYKGFGEKTQQNIKESIEFYMGSLGSFLFQQVESYALTIDKKLKKEFALDQFILTGELRRQLDIIEKIELVTKTSLSNLKTFFILLFETFFLSIPNLIVLQYNTEPTGGPKDCTGLEPKTSLLHC